MTDNRDTQNQGLQQQPDDAQRQQVGQQNQQGETRQPQQQQQNPQQAQLGQQNQQADRRQGVDATNEDDMEGGEVGGGNGDIRPDRTDDGGAQR